MHFEEVSDALGVFTELAQEQVGFLASRVSSNAAWSGRVPRHVGFTESSLLNRLRPSLALFELVKSPRPGFPSVTIHPEDVGEIVGGSLRLAPLSFQSSVAPSMVGCFTFDTCAGMFIRAKSVCAVAGAILISSGVRGVFGHLSVNGLNGIEFGDVDSKGLLPRRLFDIDGRFESADKLRTRLQF